MSTSSESIQHGDEPQRYIRDSDFFIDVKPLYIRAENTLFCVPRHYFDTSDVFQGMFTLPEVPNVPQEGSSEEYPLFLENIKADELKDFLRVLSCRVATSHETSIRSIPTSWSPVLKLSSLWQFDLLRAKSLKYLKFEGCMTRLLISRQYGVEDWFLPALKEVAVRADPLTVGEINQLGLEFAVKVIALREKARGGPCSSSSIADKEIHQLFENQPNGSA